MQRSNKVNQVEQLPQVGEGIRVASFFSGAGGLDLGFHKAGYDVVFANELVKLYCQTLEANKGNFYSSAMQVCNQDIRLMTPADLPQKIDLVIGGPPCQTFSASGRRAGGAPGRLDKRGTLFEVYSELIHAMQPRAFLFENVRGILGTNKGQDWNDIVDTFKNIGFTVSHRILDACDYGAPQQRERIFLVGHRVDVDFLFPNPLYGPDSVTGRTHITPAEALKDVPIDEDLSTLILKGGAYGHLLSEVPPGSNYLYFTEKRGYPSPIFAYRSRFSDFLYKADPNHTIKTLIASPGKYTGPFHWDNRLFSVAEYKRLQGFPDEYKFLGKRAEIIKQIGNSVSPKIAEVMAFAIAKQVFGREVDMSLMSTNKKLSFDVRKSEKAKTTKAQHAAVLLSNNSLPRYALAFSDYNASVLPNNFGVGYKNVSAKANVNSMQLVVHHDASAQPFVRMKLKLNQHLQLTLFEDRLGSPAEIEVVVYGTAPETVQAMWNAVDDLIIRSSSFNSLFELYGHFTEPHPIFSVTEFECFSEHPITKFAKHVSDFANCSRYYPKSHLTEMFGISFGMKSFTDIASTLRGFRFDIRCPETNIAIANDTYMVAYPFTLPHRKQMNVTLQR